MMSRRRLFLQLSEDQFTGLQRRPPPAETIASWRCGQHNTTVSFVSA